MRIKTAMARLIKVRARDLPHLPVTLLMPQSAMLMAKPAILTQPTWFLCQIEALAMSGPGSPVMPLGLTNKSTEAIYSYGYSQLKKVSGDSPIQTAPASSRLEDPFVVQLLDSTGRTTIPGADVTFTADRVASASLVKDPSFPDDLYDDALNDPDPFNPPTGGKSRNGQQRQSECFSSIG